MPALPRTPSIGFRSDSSVEKRPQIDVTLALALFVLAAAAFVLFLVAAFGQT